MIPMPLRDVAVLTDGSLHPVERGGVVVDGHVVTDSREAGPGSLYVARVGEHADGHAYVGPARDRGAVAALTSRVVDELPCVVVDDVQTAFGRLARGVVDRATGLTVVAVTGSSGKTSTKDLLAQVLRTAGETVAPVNSLNGEIGVPLTVCRVTPATRFLVAEMGARGVGHLAYLTTIAPPDVAVVLNVGVAHVGEFGSKGAVAQAKGELVEALPSDGVAVLNADDERVRRMAKRTSARVVTYGFAADADVRAEAVESAGLDGMRFTLVAAGERRDATIPGLGRLAVHNALAAAAVGLAAGLDAGSVVTALGRGWSAPHRGAIVRAGGVTIVDDAYNASPSSVEAALELLAGLPGRRIAVLGEMLELGPEHEAGHERVGAVAAAVVDRLIVIGDGAIGIASGARAAGIQSGRIEVVADRAAALAHLLDVLAPGDVVLVKASRGIALELLVVDLRAALESGGAR